MTTDLRRFAPLGEDFFKEAQLPGKFNPEHWEQIWTTLLVDGIGEVWYYENVEHREVVGAIGAVIAPDIHTGDLIATESFWFVSKQARSKAGFELFHKLVERAEQRGCKRVMMSAVLHSPTFLSVNKFYTQRLSMRPLETSYILYL